MSQNYPLISVVIPSYNHVKYVENCIKSILSQDYPNFEVIVIDDGSSDGSKELLTELQAKYNFYLELNQNQGLSKTLTRGFRDLAKGEYFTACASDDAWLPGKLKKQVEFFQQNPEYAMVFGKALVIDEFDTPDVLRTELTNNKLKGGNIFKELILMEFHPPVNYMWRAHILKELNYFSAEVWAEDFDMNLKIASKYPIGFINDFLSYYRVNNSIPSKNLNFKSIYSHRTSIELYKDSEYYSEALKLWYYRCFTWYAPFTAGKKIALKGMVHNLNKFLTKDFIHAMALLIFRWHKK
jgi:alpha-1,3-rhamnosyltransferase